MKVKCLTSGPQKGLIFDKGGADIWSVLLSHQEKYTMGRVANTTNLMSIEI